MAFKKHPAHGVLAACRLLESPDPGPVLAAGVFQKCPSTLRVLAAPGVSNSIACVVFKQRVDPENPSARSVTWHLFVSKSMSMHCDLASLGGGNHSHARGILAASGPP